MALLSIVMLVITETFITIESGNTRNQVQTEVNSNLRFAIEKIEGDLRTATAVTTPATGGGGSSGLLNAWTNANALPSALNWHSTVVNNGYIYTTGGTDNTFNDTSTVFYTSSTANGTLNPWQTTTALPSRLKNHSAVVNNGYIYTIAGISQGAATSTVFYTSSTANGTLNAWQTTVALPSTLYYHSAVVNNGYVYTIGGNTGGAVTSTVFYTSSTANGTLNPWQTTSPLPSAINQHSAVVNNGYIYTTGGCVACGAATSTVFYTSSTANGTLNPWQTISPLPSPLDQHSAVVNSGYIYTTGGTPNGATTTVFYTSSTANGTLNAWQTTVALPSRLYIYSAIVYNGYIYTTGGDDNGGNRTSTVFYASITPGSGGGTTSTTLIVNASGTISYCVVSGVLRRQAGGGACTASSDAITASTVNVTGATFTRFENTNSILGKTVVSVQADITMSYNATGPEDQYSEEKVTTVALRN